MEILEGIVVIGMEFDELDDESELIIKPVD